MTCPGSQSQGVDELGFDPGQSEAKDWASNQESRDGKGGCTGLRVGCDVGAALEKGPKSVH